MEEATLPKVEKGGSTPEVLDHRKLYRLPWSLPDNAISWLEPTKKCNLSCEGCYRENDSKGHKSLEQVKEDLEIFKSLRNSDCISIAGGDPLTHPQIIQIVRMIDQMGFKPVLNTNGLALTKKFLLELKKAGLKGLTIHIDSKQNRPGWKDKNEIELNELRLQYAWMAAEVGGLSCAFNATIYNDTFKYIPELVDWVHRHIDIVQVMVFILFREAILADYDYYVGGQKVDMRQLVYSATTQPQKYLNAREVVSLIKEHHPDFQPCAYLNGTEKPDSYKWLLACRIGDKDRIYGYCGPKFLELSQVWYHWRTGKYLSYVSRKITRRAKWMFLFSYLDKGIRQGAKNYFKGILKRPWRLLKKLHLQSVMIIQPIDILDGGWQNMCDGCPDITVWNGRLVWSCRMEELFKFGSFVKTVPKD
ncbi:MAG: radical SAM protein [candidate division Zixibacteria bacterium RBG_16_50_21]|nr:MAG: radical SAM protein [candidate division Zixibacteria bacterium RBG_16_50_21]